jgi:cell division protein FtsN
MPRDYKHRVNRRKRKTLSPWLGVAAGLLIGLFVAFLVYIKLQAKPDEPVYVQEILPPPAAATTQQDVHEAESNDPDATPPPPKPRFDFYTLLPEIEVVVPDEEIEQSRKPPPAVVAPVTEAAEPAASEPPPAPAATAPEPAPVKPVAKPAPAATGTYYLQVGSFSDAGKADAFRAELALMGLQTSIQRVTINSKDTYHRVRVGPFGTLDELDRTRTRLNKKGIDSTPIKVRG